MTLVVDDAADAGAAADAPAVSRATSDPLLRPSGDVRRRWLAAQTRTVWGRAHIRRIGLSEGGKPVASAMRYALAGILDERPVLVCGIGDVVARGASVDDDLARHALVERLMAEARTAGAEVVLLFSTLDAEWCRDQQFFDITPQTVALKVRPGNRPGAPMVMIRAGEDRDLPAIAAMGQIQAAPFRFHLDRDVDFVQHAVLAARLRAGLGAPGVRDVHFFVVEEGSTAAAYVVLSIANGAWTIEACGDRDPHGQRLGALLQALIARDPAAPPSVIRGWLPAAFVPPQATVVVQEISPVAVMASLIGPQPSGAILRWSDTLYWSCDVF
jgi:hypothetical protein